MINSSTLPAAISDPHGEERCEASRLEPRGPGASPTQVRACILRDAPLRSSSFAGLLRMRRKIASERWHGKLLALAVAAWPLAGCAAFSPDGGLSGVEALVTSDLPHTPVALRTVEDAATADARVRELLKKPLNPTSAVTIALLNNRSLQAAYNTLGISEATMVRASLPPNPTFSLSRVARGGAYEIEAFVIASVLDLATLPARADLAQDRFRQAQLQAVLETLRIAVTARRAYVRAVASRALVGYLEQATQSGEAAAHACKASRRDGRDEQARPGAQPGLLPSSRRNSRPHAKLPRANASSWSARSACGAARWTSACRRSCRHCRGGRGRCPRSRPRRCAGGSTCRWRASKPRCLPSPTVSRAPRASSTCSMPVRPTSKRREDHLVSRERGFEVELEIPLYDFGEVRVREAEQGYMRAVNQLTGEGGQCPLRGARRVSQLPRHLRYRQAVSARRASLAQDHLGRDAASLQRHADRRVRAAHRGAPAHRCDDRGAGGAAGILPR